MVRVATLAPQKRSAQALRDASRVKALSRQALVSRDRIDFLVKNPVSPPARRSPIATPDSFSTNQLVPQLYVASSFPSVPTNRIAARPLCNFPEKLFPLLTSVKISWVSFDSDVTT